MSASDELREALSVFRDALLFEIPITRRIRVVDLGVALAALFDTIPAVIEFARLAFDTRLRIRRLQARGEP